MCAQSQFISAKELWEGFNPDGFDQGYFVIFRGYIDESYGADRNVFALSCILARGKEWDEFERKWKLHIAAKNRVLVKDGRRPITRYHASDCSGRRKEFRGWTHDERDAFVKGLFLVFKQVETFTVVFDVQLAELCEVFPEQTGDPLEAAYYWLTKFLMLTISNDFRKWNKANRQIRITLFHDRTGGDGAYDPVILKAFNSLKNDPTFSGRDIFATIAPLCWKNCILLQPADLVAFENFKQAEARLEKRASRRSFDALLDMKKFGIDSKTFGKPALVAFRELLEKAQTKSL